MQQPLRPSVPQDLFRSERLVYRAWDAERDIDAVYEWLQDGETVTSMSPRMITYVCASIPSIYTSTDELAWAR